MKEICKRIAVVTAIMFITLGGCVSYASDEGWWLPLIPAGVGILILTSIYVAEKIENARMRKLVKDYIVWGDKFITISTNGKRYRIPIKKSDFEELFEKHSKE